MKTTKRFKLPRTACTAYALIIAGTFVTQQTFADNKAEVLETGSIEVVGTTPLPSIGTPINQVPSNVQAASSKAINEQRNLDISEFIDANLGSVSTSNSVANPYQADVSFRGFTASPLLGTPQGMSVFMDGVRVNEPFGDIVNWDIIPANAISSINLIPGSNPLFGLNTLGGALAVHTKSGSEFPGVSLTGYGGSWGRRAVEFEAGGTVTDKSLDYFVAGNAFKEDGWREHSASDVKQLFGKLGWQNDKSDLDLSFTLGDTNMEGTQALPTSMLGNRKRAYSWPDSIGNHLAMINLKGSHFLTDDKLIASEVYFRKNRIGGFNSNLNDEYDPGTDDIQANNVSSTTDQNGFGGTLQMTLLGDLMGFKNQFTGGASADFGRTDFSSNTYEATVVDNQTVTKNPLNSQGSVRLNARNDYYGLYLTDTFSITDQLHTTLSGRYNIAKVRLSGFNVDKAGTTNDLSGSHRYGRFNPAIGLNYNPSKVIGFYGGYNEGMRAATPVELSCADPNVPCALPNSFASDPHLKAVVSKTWEGGMRGRVWEGLNWNVGFFDTRNSNDIVFTASSTTANQGYFQNVGNTERRGVELGVSGRADRFSFAVNYGFVDATFQTPFTANSKSNSSADANGRIQVSKGSKIPGIPEHTVKLRLGYDITPSWMVGSNIVAATGQYARGDENNQDTTGKVPGYAVLHFDTHYSISDNWKLFAKINNVFDSNYTTFGVLGKNAFSTGAYDTTVKADDWQKEQFRSPAAPRAAWVGVTYEFGKPKGSAGAKPDLD